MNKITSYFLVFVSGAVFSCKDDLGFTAKTPEISVTIVEDADMGFVYSSTDAENLTITMGEVNVFAPRRARYRIENTGSVNLELRDILPVDAEVVGASWFHSIVPDAGTNTIRATRSDSPWPKVLGSEGVFFIDVTFDPSEEGTGRVFKLTFDSDASGQPVMTVLADAGPPLGEADIEVAYGSYVGPTGADCSAIETVESGSSVLCALPTSLDFGNISLGSSGVSRVTVRNRANCPEFPNVAACSSCSLRLNDVGFKDYDNPTPFCDNPADDGYAFCFEGSIATPFFLKRRNVDCPDGPGSCICNESGEISFLIRYRAPETEASDDVTLVLESNDPDEPLIEIPVSAASRNAPIAIAKFQELDPANPSAPYTDPSDIEPLTRVYLNGCDSYDPRDENDPDLITSYSWDIQGPPDADPSFYEPEQSGCLFNFKLPLAGPYVVSLTVVNDIGIESGDTAESRVEFNAVPNQQVLIELVWDDPSNDQDLHLTYLTGPNTPDNCSDPTDCYYENCKLNSFFGDAQWFPDAEANEGPNPWLDQDDVNGLGPERITIEEPRGGHYLIGVNYFTSSFGGSVSPTRNTIRVFLNGIQRGEFSRVMTNSKDFWKVARIIWPEDNSQPLVIPYPSSDPNLVGEVVADGCDDDYSDEVP